MGAGAVLEGYKYDKAHDIYICNYCAQNFEVGQIYSISNNFYTAEQGKMSKVSLNRRRDCHFC